MRYTPFDKSGRAGDVMIAAFRDTESAFSKTRTEYLINSAEKCSVGITGNRR